MLKLSSFILIFLGTVQPIFTQALTSQQKSQAKALIQQNPDVVKQVQDGASKAGSMTPQQTEQARQILKDNPELLSNQAMKSKNSSIAEGSDAATPITEKVATSLAADTAKVDKNTLLNSTELQVYGSHLFSQDYQTSSSPDVPENYIIVPGDQILLRLWGRYNLEKIYTIGDDGYVFIDPLNKQIYLKGTSHKQFKRMIRNTVNDMAGVEGEARVIATHPVKINIAGQATRPGTILIPPYFTFWQALMTSRGPSKTGSLRDIRLIRGNSTKFTLDLYNYLHTGKIPNTALKDGDLILYGNIGNLVEIQGIAKRSDKYELKKSETLDDLIKHAGGFKAKDISPIVQIERIIPIYERSESGPTRKIIDVQIKGNSWKKFRLKDGDLVSEKVVISSFENQAYIQGLGVKIPGRYSISKNEFTLWNLVEKAGGLVDGFSSNMEIVRQTESGKTSIPITIDEKGQLREHQVLPYDSILTYHQTQFEDHTFITVRGFVRDSLRILYTKNLTLSNVINRAGGLRDGALPYVYIKKRDDSDNISYQKVETSQSETYLMEKRDEVFTFNYRNFHHTFPVTVLVDGRRSLVTDYSKDLTLRILFHKIGGLPVTADSNQIELNRPDFNQLGSLVNSQYTPLNEKTLDSKQLITPGLLIIVRKDSKKSSAQFVHLIGEFVNPGTYALLSNKETLLSVINRANGLTNRGNPYSIQIHRKNHFDPIPISINQAQPLTFNSHWVLNDGDSIFVLRNDNTVRVEGAVFTEAVVPFNNKYGWKDYVNSGGGGPIDTADVRKTYIVYPNGYSHKAKKGWFSHSKVVPGARIVVPMKPYEPPKQKNDFKYSEFIGNLASTVTVFISVLTAYVLVTKD